MLDSEHDENRREKMKEVVKLEPAPAVFRLSGLTGLGCSMTFCLRLINKESTCM